MRESIHDLRGDFLCLRKVQRASRSKLKLPNWSLERRERSSVSWCDNEFSSRTQSFQENLPLVNPNP